MLKKATITTALMTVGVFSSLGYTAIAQMNKPTTPPNPLLTQPNPTTQPTTPLNPTNRPPTQPNSTRISAVDEQFVLKAALGGMAEVELSQLALRRANSNEVKQYAQRMVQDHTQANAKLSQLAAQKGVTLPTSIDAQHQTIKRQLEQMRGRRFDQAYMRVMEADHAKTVALFQNQAQRGQDPDLKTFATTTLPKLQGHWEMVRAMLGNNAAQTPNSPR